MKLLKLFLLALCLISATLAGWSEEPDHADHEELRQLLAKVQGAMNEQKYSEMAPFFQDKCCVTLINAEAIRKPSDFEAYFKGWIGEGQYVKSLKMSLTADDLTEFHGTGTDRYGVVCGTGTENYDLKDGRHLDLKTRWTATVTKDSKGKWRILALHLGANFYNNPIVSELQGSVKTYGIGGIAVGFLVGFAICWVIRKPK